MAVVFLDLYGVLADSRVMDRAYNERMAAILRSRFGGSLDGWRALQQASYEWYKNEGAKLDARPGPEREGDAWVEAVAAMNAAQLAWMFRRAGLEVPADAARFAEDLEAETVRGIDALYADAIPALRGLKRAGHGLFLSTNANRANAESALVGGGVRDLFDGLAMLETARAKKDRPYYWRRAFELAGADATQAVVVDDEARYLDAAAGYGARCVQLIRPGRAREPGRFPVIDSLAALEGVLR